jgi:hypothetical protein
MDEGGGWMKKNEEDGWIKEEEDGWIKEEDG